MRKIIDLNKELGSFREILDVNARLEKPSGYVKAVEFIFSYIIFVPVSYLLAALAYLGVKAYYYAVILSMKMYGFFAGFKW